MGQQYLEMLAIPLGVSRYTPTPSGVYSKIPPSLSSPFHAHTILVLPATLCFFTYKLDQLERRESIILEVHIYVVRDRTKRGQSTNRGHGSPIFI